MANLKLSQIAGAGTAPALADQVVGVSGGATDNLYTLSQVASTVSSGITSLALEAPPFNVIGAELVTDGNFATNPALSGWTLNDNTWSVGQVSVTINSGSSNNAILAYSIAVTANSWYLVTLNGTMTLDAPEVTFASHVQGGGTTGTVGTGSAQVWLLPVQAFASGTFVFNIDITNYVPFSTRVLTSVSIKQISAPTPGLAITNWNGDLAFTTGPMEYGQSVLLGVGAGANLPAGGSTNIALGPSALGAATGGSESRYYCVALGTGAMQFAHPTGTNIAIGAACLQRSTGANNIAIGRETLQLCSTGSWNVIVGQSAANALTTGSTNCALGEHALQNMTTGSGNIAIGYGTGGSVINTGNQNILIGQGLDTPSGATSNYLTIGGAIKGQMDTGPITCTVPVLVKGSSKSGLPTTTDIPTGQWGVFKDTAGGTVNLAYNDAGTIKKVALT